MNIKLRVNNLIKKYHTKDPFKLARKLNIEIIQGDLGNIRGFYKKILKNKFIFINSEMSEIEQKLVCAHELGHALFHSSNKFIFSLNKTRLTRKTKIEQEANLFAKYLLYNEDEDNYYKIEELKKISYYVFEEFKNIKE